MSSPHTFFGKVITLLVGSVLSWFTVMNPDFSAFVDALLGESPSLSSAEETNPARLPMSDQGQAAMILVAEEDTSVDPKPHGQSQIREIAIQLRQLGASYLLLEKLPNPNGDQYRVRCDLAGDTSPVKCCFEATRKSAEAAMHDVLQAVLNMDTRHSGLSESVVSST